jgi:probable addiction module antidote protein
MAKQEILKMQKKFSKKVVGKVLDPNEKLRDKKFIARALFEALTDGDDEAFKEILSAHFEALKRSELSENSGVKLRTLYRMTTPNANPTLKNIAKVFKALSAA